MARTAALGFPRIGSNRELKFALEQFWSGSLDEGPLRETARSLRAANWKRATERGIDVIPSGDFSFYDHVLDTAFAFSAIPERFGGPTADGLSTYFAMARGNEDVRPLEMTKWFDTNYHFLVPELSPGQPFKLRAAHWIDQFEEAKALGIKTRPVILGPASFLLVSKGLDRPLELLDTLVPIYVELLAVLKSAGVEEVQIDEPGLVTDLNTGEFEAVTAAWKKLGSSENRPDISLTTYFAGLSTAGPLNRVLEFPVEEVHLDLVRDPSQLAPALKALEGSTTRLSLGVIDGRNIWASDLDVALDRIDSAAKAIGDERVTIATSCSTLHLPVSVASETAIDPEVRSWLAFATERLDELSILGSATRADDSTRDALLQAAREVISNRRTSAHTNNPAVRARAGKLTASDFDRNSPFPDRREVQRAELGLPELPTTTIGSFPQTAEIREARRKFRLGETTTEQYDEFIRAEIEHVVKIQEGLGLNVLVHGEPERNDMVEYFGQQLDGFTFSANGWVQSYGSRCVKPPILFGDVSRPNAMTVAWWQFAQSLTEKPMKGMLTGPVTILQWSFVRDDQPRSETCTQIALAVQDEVLDLQRAGATIIQVDEAAVREGLPIQHRFQDDYLRWAIDCFRLTVAPVEDRTQIHTHMCYSEFNEMMEHVARLDADVLSIEASRSDMEVLDSFSGSFSYPNEVGPGVYDIHSPRVPSVEEIERLLALAEDRLDRDQLWVNPDCGLKTRAWPETIKSLENMMTAATRRRALTHAER